MDSLAQVAPLFTGDDHHTFIEEKIFADACREERLLAFEELKECMAQEKKPVWKVLQLIENTVRKTVEHYRALRPIPGALICIDIDSTGAQKFIYAKDVSEAECEEALQFINIEV